MARMNRKFITSKYLLVMFFGVSVLFGFTNASSDNNRSKNCDNLKVGLIKAKDDLLSSKGYYRRKEKNRQMWLKAVGDSINALYGVETDKSNIYDAEDQYERVRFAYYLNGCANNGGILLDGKY